MSATAPDMPACQLWTQERARMAYMLGYSRNHPNSWPIDLIDDLLAAEPVVSRDRFVVGLGKIMRRLPR